MSAKDFEDLEIWKLARELTNRIYSLSNQGNFAKDYVLRDQIRRAAVSIMSNIAEGFERGGKQDSVNFCRLRKARVAKRDAKYILHWIKIMLKRRTVIC